MDFASISDLLRASADALTPILAAWAVWWGASRAAATYRWQKALDQRTWWYRRMLVQLIEYKTAVVKFSMNADPSDADRAAYLRAVHRMIRYSALSALYAGPTADDAVWRLRRTLEALEERSPRLHPQHEIDVLLTSIQQSINKVSAEAREIIGIPAKAKSDGTLTETDRD